MEGFHIVPGCATCVKVFSVACCISHVDASCMPSPVQVLNNPASLRRRTLTEGEI